jgi:hypothetical protein
MKNQPFLKGEKEQLLIVVFVINLTLKTATLLIEVPMLCHCLCGSFILLTVLSVLS